MGEFCRVDLRRLHRDGALKEGQDYAGVMRWRRGGEEAGSMGYSVRLDGEDRRLILSYSYGGDHRTVTVTLEAVPMPYGGVRHFARCPVSGRRCLVLPVVAGVVACRQAHRLSYATQSLDQLGRLRERAERFEARLHAKKRRGANKARLLDAWIEADVAFEEAFAAETLRRFAMVF